MKRLMLASVLCLPAFFAQAQPIEGTAQALSSPACGSVVIVKCNREIEGSATTSSVAQAGEARTAQGATWDKLQQRRLNLNDWTLDRILVEGERVRRPGIPEVLAKNLGAPGSVRFETVDVGDGGRCTLALPYGYEECTRPIDRVGKVIDGPWK
jgi:hypothetical protein